jgi:micrococcal nuclease
VLVLLDAGCTEAQTSSLDAGQSHRSALASESAGAQPGGSGAPDAGTAGDGDTNGATDAASPVTFDVVAATVTRVVDGDTAVMTLSSGTSERVRFIGVDTPESTTQHEPYGTEASSFTKQRLTGKRVWLQIGTEERDRYGRLLAYIWLQEPLGISEAELRTKQFNAQLLVEGYAQLLTIPPNVEYVEYYREFQTEAREANRGLWGLPAAGSTAPVPVPPPGAGTGSSSGGASSAAYIGNRNSMKLHRAECRYVNEMSPENKVPLETREAAISAGYVPCKVCRP